MGHEPMLTLVWSNEDPLSQQVAKVASRVVADNRATGLTLEAVNASTNPDRAVELGAMLCPTLILTCEGAERGRLTGSSSQRGVLQMVLPELYPDEIALLELRAQLRSQGEDFPRRAQRRRQRVSQRRRLDTLKQLPLFAPLSRSMLTTVAKAADELVVEAGTILTSEGEPGDQFFAVVDGGLAVARGGRTVGHLGPGDCFGEVSLLDGGPRTATVTATEHTLLLAIDRNVFRAMLESSADMAVALLEVTASRLRENGSGSVGG